MTEILEQISLNNNLMHAINIAHSVARENLNKEVSPAHLLKALLHQSMDLHSLIKSIGEDIHYLEEWADVRIEALDKSSRLPEQIQVNAAVTEVLYEADIIRIDFSKDNIAPSHVMAALCTPGIGFSYDQLKTFPLKRDVILNHELSKAAVHSAFRIEKEIGSSPLIKSPQNALLKYCTDKSSLAREGRLSPIIGRDKEIRMMAEILCRHAKPNVLIVGEPGVGKSALVDAFALAILQQAVPQLLYNARIVEMNIGSLIAGASYKGEIEDRLKSIISDIRQSDRTILFIDEIHSLLDKNSAAAGAINLLKPELARGELTVIAATTLDEYRRIIQKDEAFNRRFEILMVEEPDITSCFHMVKAIIPGYQRHHAISVPDETIRFIVEMSKRYIKDRRLPDAALDLADRAMASLRLINDTGKKDLQHLKIIIEEWNNNEEGQPVRSFDDWQWLYLQMKNKISPILWNYFQSEEDPASFTQSEMIISYLKKSVIAMEKATDVLHTELDKNDVAAVISYKTGIPVGKVQTKEKERLLNMESVLKQRVVGQDHAIRILSDAVLESRSGLNKLHQPIGSFFFLGPTGTGKTELAKALAEFLFQDDSSMIRFDMSEFKEEHAAALLYGAPPGYVGYEEGGLLVNKIRQKPYSVVLFDEIEKAHASVFDLFLQIMDEGKLHDKLGKEGDFSNALIIFTSNIGSQYVEASFNKGEVPSSDKLMQIMADYFRPEFLGRLTEILPFASMNEVMIKNILQIQLKGLHGVLNKKGIHLTISDGATSALSNLGFSPKYGARPLNGVIRSLLRRPLSRMIIKGELELGSKVHLDVNDDNTLVWK